MDLDAELEALRMRFAVALGRPAGRGVWATWWSQTDGTDREALRPCRWEVSVGGPYEPFQLKGVGATQALALRGLTAYVDEYVRTGHTPLPCEFSQRNYTVCPRCGRTRDPDGGNGPCMAHALRDLRAEVRQLLTEASP